MKSTLTILVFSCLLVLSLQGGFQCNIANCQFCSYPNQCGLCNQNFVLMLNTTIGASYCQAVTCPSNCGMCYQNNICQTCNPGFFITMNGSCASQASTNSSIPPNCLWGSNSQNCSLCSYGYTLQAGYCYPTIVETANDVNCLVKLTSYICQICVPTFIVGPLGNCMPNTLTMNGCPTNCAYCTGNNTCTLCMPGFQLTSLNTCTNNVCNTDGCMACASNGQCSACMVGYVLNSVAKVCQKVGYGCNDQNCMICNSPQSCGQCKPGFTVVNYQTGATTVGICQTLSCPFSITNCQTCGYSYNSDFNFQELLCVQCNAGYTLANGYCLGNLMTFPCNVANCTQCLFQNYCTSCQAGFMLTSTGTCMATQCNIPNCVSCGVNNICQQCQQNYTLVLAGITAAQQNLYSYAVYVLTQQCVQNIVSCNVSNCAYCITPNNCVSCATGYDFASNSSNCVPICNVANCLQCNQGNTNTCAFCEPQFMLRLSGSQCAPISFNCSTGCNNMSCIYNWVTGQPQCTQCLSSFTLFNGMCFPKTCNLFGCSLCASWASPAYCIMCSQGLVLLNGYCSKLNCMNNIPNCINCIQNNVCIGCAAGFLLTTNSSGTAVCVAAPAPVSCMINNCILCSVSNSSQCQTCAKGYTQKNGQCFCSLPNCLSCTQTSVTCDYCVAPLFSSLQTAGCVPQPSLINTCNVPNCHQCLTSTQCSVCSTGYSLNPTNFTCTLNNCASFGLTNCQLCDNFGLCNFCEPGFMISNFLQDGQCLPVNPGYTCNITGCAVCSSTNNSQCASCLPTFMANGTSQCVPYSCNISNCYYCLQNNFCTVCTAGFYLTTNLTCVPLTSNLANCQNQIPFCAMCLANTTNGITVTTCVQCQFGFQYNSASRVCIPQMNSIPNCKVQLTWSMSGMLPYCQVCEQGYYINSYGLCSQLNPAINNTGCTVYNCLYCALNSSQCSFCFQPWGISSTGVCQTSVFCSANCQLCVNSSVCLTCVTSYTVASNGQCVFCPITGCATCNQPNICSTCSPGFTLTTTGNCILCNVTNCAQCSSPNFCQNCNSLSGTPLFPSTNGGSCVACNTSLPNLGNCLSCSSSNSCGQCQNGFQVYTAPLTTNSVCIQCNIQNCQSCGLSGNTIICLICSPGYSSVSGMCIQCSYPCVTCTSALGPNNCATCSTPMFFSAATFNGTCVVNLIPNCVSYNTLNTSQCNGCAAGYSYNGTANSCVFSCPSNCLICTSITNCSTCIQGFYLTTNNICSQCQVTGCSSCSNNGTVCLTCFTGFYLITGECKTCPGYCSSCNSNNSCTSLIQSNQQVLIQIGNQTLLALCQSNCLTCSNINPQICLQCQSGFFLNNGNCFKCSTNCMTCNSSNINQCFSCYPNNFLTANTCSSCSSSCLTCASANQPFTCTSCRVGFFLSNSQCIPGCPLNCITCSSANVCLKCASGYTLFNRGLSTICVTCTTSCRTCAEGRPASCLSCGAGFYLNGNTCSQCSTNCLTCTASGCISCINGFFLTSAQTCSRNCQLPCATCSAITPSKCTSCIAGYSYNNILNSCSQIITCGGGCSVCPLGYTLNLGTCIACTASQCQTCNSTNTNQCFSCLPGFYLNSVVNLCQACPVNCATCLTGSGCLTCATGFTQIANAPQMPGGFQCIACNSPCATCINTPDYCTSCIPGYQFFGWKCAQSFYFSFQLTLSTNIITFNQNYFNFLTTLSNAIGSANPDAITIISITGGSVVIQGGAGPTAPSGTQLAANQYNNFIATVSQSSSIAGMPVVQSQTSVIGGTVDFQKVNLALILGICIPVGVLLIAGIVLYIYCKKKRSAQNIEQRIKEDTGFTVRQSFELSARYKEQNTIN